MSIFRARTLNAPTYRADVDDGYGSAWSAFSADGTLVLRVVDGLTLKAISLLDGSERVLGKEAKYVASLHLAANGWACLVEDRRSHHAVTSVDAATGKSTSFKSKASVRFAAVLTPGRVVTHVDETVGFADAKTGAALGDPLPTRVDKLAVSARGILATSWPEEKTSVTLWDGHAATARVPALGASGSSVTNLTFSPDGSRLAFFDDGVLRVVDVATGQAVLTLKDPKLQPNVHALGMVSNEIVVALSAAARFLKRDEVITVSTLALGDAKAQFVTALESTGFDGHPAIAPHGILVNRRTLLAREVPASELSSVATAPPEVIKETKKKVDPAKAAEKKPAKAAEKKPAKATSDAKPTSSKGARPVLHLTTKASKSLKKNATEAYAILSEHFELAELGADSPEYETAETAGRALKGIDCTSDIDWDYVPCVLVGAESVGPHLEVLKATKKVGAEQLLADMADVAPADLLTYLSVTALTAFKHAGAVLTGAGEVRQLRLTHDAEDGYTVVLTLAAGEAASAGVLTVRCDT